MTSRFHCSRRDSCAANWQWSDNLQASNYCDTRSVPSGLYRTSQTLFFYWCAGYLSCRSSRKLSLELELNVKLWLSTSTIKSSSYFATAFMEDSSSTSTLVSEKNPTIHEWWIKIKHVWEVKLFRLNLQLSLIEIVFVGFNMAKLIYWVTPRINLVLKAVQFINLGEHTLLAVFQANFHGISCLMDLKLLETMKPLQTEQKESIWFYIIENVKFA